LETNKHHAARRKTHKKAAAVVAAIDKMESIENWFISMKEYFRLKNKKKLNFMRSRMKKEKLVFGEQPGGLVDSFLREMRFLQKKQTNSLTIFSQFHHWLDCSTFSCFFLCRFLDEESTDKVRDSRVECRSLVGIGQHHPMKNS
jgi:hypothetical protein